MTNLSCSAENMSEPSLYIYNYIYMCIMCIYIYVPKMLTAARSFSGNVRKAPPLVPSPAPYSD